MKLIVLAVGRVRSPAWREICADYLARLQRYGPVELKELKAADDAVPAQALSIESTRVLQALGEGDPAWILDERGVHLSSTQLARMLQEHELHASKRLVFVVGGAFGLDARAKARGKLLALSHLTLPHELCRALLLEQLYRARTILRGEPYHHG